MEESATRRKRINRLKKMILGGVMMAVLIPVTASIILSVRAHQLSDRIRQQEAVIQELEDENKNLAGAFLTETIEESEREALQEEQDAGTPAAGEEEEGQKKIYLTFDDGPSDKNTEAILKILQDEHIHATFFLTGKNVERYPEVVKAIYASGNAIGIHSYSHVYDRIYASPAAYMKEVDQTANLIYQVIHARPIISRAPGGTAGHFTRSFWDALRAQGYIEVGWNALTGDADGTGKTAAKSVENLKKQLQQRPYLQSHLVILMHDGAGHEATVKALPQIIKLLKEKGYTFRVVTTAIPPCW